MNDFCSSCQGFMDVMLYSDVVQYQCFGGPCCLHLQGEVNGTGKGTQVLALSKRGGTKDL